MSDFSHLQKYAVTDQTTAEYVFARIEGDPSVILAPAHEVNPEYHRARLAMTLELADKMAGTKVGKATPEEMIRQTEAEREADRKLLAQYCTRSWGVPPKDAKGKDAEFSTDNAYAFYKAMPPEMFDPMRNFAGNLFNFFPERNKPLTEESGEPLGNS